MLSFGYNAGLPAGTKAAWGCRAIVDQQGYVDVPPDRVSMFGEQADKDALLATLNDVGFGWRTRAAELLIDGDMHTREAAEHELFNNGRVVIKGNTNASAGYLYVCAYNIAREGA